MKPKPTYARKELLKALQNAKKRYAYWNQGARRTGSKAHFRKELYAADICRLKEFLNDLKP